MADCNQKGCPTPAQYTFVWPGGGEQSACGAHTERAASIAEAMGLPRSSLVIKPIDGAPAPVVVILHSRHRPDDL